MYGDNAQGKTNILESVYLCSTTRSHRGSKDREIIRMDEKEAHIRLRLEKREIEHCIDMHLKKKKAKGIAIDGIPIRKSSELIGLVHVVFFSPEDLSIIKNGPAERRRFMDMELSQLDRVYLHNLTQYNKVMLQRNNLLKQIGFNSNLLDTLEIWDLQLAEYGRHLIARRREFLQELEPTLQRIHNRLSGGKEDLTLLYEMDCGEDTFLDKIKQARDRDLYLKTTTVGPHRDDMTFLIKDINLRRFGSQGQQRTAALALKLAQIDILKQKTKDSPILLLDDVLSELDRHRQNYLLESIQQIQTLVTCTGLEEFVKDSINIDRIFRVVEGTITEEDIK